MAVLSSLGDIKLYNATLECTANHSAHIYIHTMRSVFSFSFGEIKLLGGVVTAKGVRSGSQVQVQVEVWGRSHSSVNPKGR